MSRSATVTRRPWLKAGSTRWRMGVVLLFALMMLAASARAQAQEPVVLYDQSFDQMPKDWVPVAGDWAVENGQLKNYDPYTDVTNIYAEVAQQGKVLTYEWEVAMVEAYASWAPLAGLHFLADSGDQGNHGNSYFLFQASTVLKLYKSVDNRLIAQWDLPEYAAIVGETYRFRLIFHTDTGLMQVYLNDQLVQEWTDPDPIQSGKYVAFRTNQTVAGFSYLKITASE